MTVEEKQVELPVQGIFYESYEKVWRAAQFALSGYPLAVNNIDTGKLETDEIKGFDIWKPPHEKKEPGSGMRSRIDILVSKGRAKGRPSVRVRIDKKIEVQKDFFSDVESLQSDGFEEKVILYRIQRELAIERALAKASSQAQ